MIALGKPTLRAGENLMVNQEEGRYFITEAEETSKAYPCAEHIAMHTDKCRDGFVLTGEKRAPRKGEWYLSGAVPQAWQAKNDLTTEYHILKPARA